VVKARTANLVQVVALSLWMALTAVAQGNNNTGSSKITPLPRDLEIQLALSACHRTSETKRLSTS